MVKASPVRYLRLPGRALAIVFFFYLFHYLDWVGSFFLALFCLLTTSMDICLLDLSSLLLYRPRVPVHGHLSFTRLLLLKYFEKAWVYFTQVFRILLFYFPPCFLD